MLFFLLKSIFFILVSILSVKYILFWMYVWQLKEYRIDRFNDFLRSREGKNAFLNKFYLVKIFAVILWVILWKTGQIGNAGSGAWELPIHYVFCSAIFLLVLFETVIFLIKVLKRKIIKPVFTEKAILLCGIPFLIYFIFLWMIFLRWRWQEFVLASIFMLSAVSLFTALVNLIISPISIFFKKRKARRAMEAMDNFKGTVIGITGSYGKTSVKELTAALLEKKFNVFKTPKNINTEIGIANFILSENTSPSPSSERRGRIVLPLSEGESEGVLRERDEECFISSKFSNYTFPAEKRKFFFVCEMGAYKIGEIEAICKMVKPQIGILTGINEQHVALFGSILNTIKAKSELIVALDSNGLAIINNDDKNCQKVKVFAGVRKITYGFLKGSDCRAFYDNKKIDCVSAPGQEITDNLCLEFTVQYKGESVKMKLHALGKHNIANLLPAIIVANEYGVSLKEIAKLVEELEVPQSSLKMRKFGGAMVINDTYNSNPTGLKSALELLDSMPQEFKVLVLDDIWELGKESQRIHVQIARELARKNYDKLILVGTNYSELLMDVLLKNNVNRDKIIKIKESYSFRRRMDTSGRGGSDFASLEIKQFLDGLKNENCAILFEGRRAGNYLERFAIIS